MQSNEIKVFDEVLHKYCILPRHCDIEYLTAMNEGHKGSIQFPILPSIKVPLPYGS